MIPYNTYEFRLKAMKYNKIKEISVLITIIELDIPILKTEIPSGFLDRKINLNE